MEIDSPWIQPLNAGNTKLGQVRFIQFEININGSDALPS